MSAQHTPGRLFVTESTEHWGRVNCHLTAEVYQACIGSIWVNGTSQNRADARRLVACWNACDGIPTARIEAGAVDVLAYSMELKAQRDELRAALTRIRALPVHPDAIRMAHTHAETAIAKVEGGAA